MRAGDSPRAQLSQKLRETVDAASAVIERLTTEQLTRTYEIQIYKASGVEAVFHVVEHFAHHAGQIIFATKMLTGADLGFYSHLREKSRDKSGQPIALVTCMLHWSIVFLIIALIAGVLGFTGIAGAAMGIAKILFFVFLVIWLVVFLMIRKAV